MPLPDKVDAITRLEQPVTVKGLQEFVGMVNFYHRFISAAARTMIPLFEALAGKPRTLVWNDARVKAFQDTKKALANATLLTHPHPDTHLAHRRRFGLSSRGCPPAVCRWCLDTLSLLQPETTTTREKVQCFRPRTTRSLLGHTTFTLLPRGQTIRCLH